MFARIELTIHSVDIPANYDELEAAETGQPGQTDHSDGRQSKV